MPGRRITSDDVDDPDEAWPWQSGGASLWPELAGEPVEPPDISARIIEMGASEALDLAQWLSEAAAWPLVLPA